MGEPTVRIVFCPSCDGTASSSKVATTFPYGPAPSTVHIPVTLTVHTCCRCSEEFLSGDAEAVKTEATLRHLQQVNAQQGELITRLRAVVRAARRPANLPALLQTLRALLPGDAEGE